MRAGRRNVRITHPDKVLFPDGTTKADLAGYYRDVAGVMLPHVRELRFSMQRFNGGIGHPGFFQKDIPKGAPEWVPTVRIPKKGGVVHDALANETATLVWLAEPELHHAARLHRARRPPRPPGPDHLGSRPVGRGRVRARAPDGARARGAPARGGQRAVRHGHGLARDPRRRRAHAPLVLRGRPRRGARRRRRPRRAASRRARRRPSARRSARAGCSSTSIATAARRPRSRPTRSARGWARPSATPVHWPEVEDDGLRPDAWTLADRPRPPRGRR